MDTIILTGADLVTSSAAEQARNRRDTLLALVPNLPPVTDAASQALVTEALRDLRGFYKEIQAGREAAKAPVLRIGREIDALAADLCAQVEAEGKRLGLILGAYDLEQAKIAEQKRQAAAAEERRIREEAARLEREAEQRRRDEEARILAEEYLKARELQAEADAKAARARTDAGRERAAKEALQRQQEAKAQALRDLQAREAKAAAEQKARDDAETLRVAQNRQALEVATAKPKGTSTREEIKFEVSDLSALYEAAPYLVTLTPNNAAIKSALKGLQPGQNLPGVRHWREASTITRG